jgi:hypothetical protein
MGKCVEAARLIGIELHFLDRLGKLVNAFVMSGHLPSSSGYSDDQYTNSLGMLEDLLARRSPTAILFIVADSNARLGTRADYSIEEEAPGII